MFGKAKLDVPRPDEMVRSGPIDGLRGVAILLVLFWHGYFLLSDLRGLSWSGVDLFFVLSGYLIGGILIENRGSRGYFSVFYVRRFARILPLYLILLAAYWLIPFLGWENVPALAKQFEPGPPYWMYWVFWQNTWLAEAGNWGPQFVSVTWSLAVEEQFYFLAPVVLLVTPRFAIPILCVALIVAAPFFRMWAFENVGRLAPHLLLPSRMDSLMLGVLLAWLIKTIPVRSFLERYWLALMAPLALLACAMWFMASPQWGIGSRFMNEYGYTVVSLFYFTLVLIVLVARNRWLNEVTSFLPLRWCGILCFPLYLLHMPFLAAWDGWLLPLAERYIVAQLPFDQFYKWLTMGLRFACLIALSLAVHFAIERPFMKLGKRNKFRPKDEKPPSHAAAPQVSIAST